MTKANHHLAVFKNTYTFSRLLYKTMMENAIHIIVECEICGFHCNFTKRKKLQKSFQPYSFLKFHKIFRMYSTVLYRTRVHTCVVDSPVGS